MQVVLIILSVGLLGVIIYFALSPKSSRLLKLSARIALGLIALAVGICCIFLIKGPSDKTPDISLPIFQDSEPVPKKSNAGAVWIFLVIMLAMIAFIVFLSLKDQRNRAGGKKAPALKMPGAPVFTDNVTLDIKGSDDTKSEGKEEDDTFDIKLN
jgi:membrane associated rhomboid family serine protease